MKALILALLVVGCGEAPRGGGDGGAPKAVPETEISEKTETAENFAMAVPTEADLPTCNSAAKYRLVYVKASGEFKTCDGWFWNAIELETKKKEVSAIKKISVCPASTTDLDPETDIVRKGSGALITEFANGDFFITCDSVDIDNSYLDTATASQFWPKDSIGVIQGKLSCVALYVSAEYWPASNKVAYVLNSDESNRSLVNCKQSYP